MSLSRIAAIIRRELRLGWRNPLFLFAIVMPIALTAIFQLVFGNLFIQKPVLAVYDLTGGTVTSELEKSEAVVLIEADSERELRSLVEEREADMGFVFPSNMKSILRGDDKLILKAYVDGEAYASDRAIIAATVAEVTRNLAPAPPDIDFEQVRIGSEQPITIIDIIAPFLVVLAVLYSAFLLPSTLLVREKERKTISALLVTPTSRSEIVSAYGLLGAMLSIVMAIVVLVLNGILNQPFLMMLFIVLGSVFMVEIGLIAGLIFNDINTLFANIKLFAVVLIAPVLFIIFPDWPQWIARLFPTHYLIHPIFRISVYSEGIAEIGWEALALAAFIGILVLPIAMLAKRLGNQ